MVRSHHDRLNRGRFGINQFPGFARIGASPQPSRLRVHNFWVERVENEKPDYPAQIEHAPGLSSVVCNVCAGHVAGDQNSIWIVRADGGIEHRSPAPGTYNLKIPGANAECRSYEQKGENHPTPDAYHLILSFTFDIFASPLSGKVPKMSTAKWRDRGQSMQ